MTDEDVLDKGRQSAAEADTGAAATGDGGRPSDAPLLVAALGASAGGLEALQAFFDHVPPETGIAYVVVQHLDPNRDSIGPELLGTHTEMPVRQAEEGDVLRPNHVYVTPPDASMSVREGTLHLESPKAKGPPTIVDRFFHSLAEDQGPRAVAILFSGSGSDGAVGIGQVREARGLTMVQDPATARFDSMPRHGITTGKIVDVLSPSGLAERLAEYAKHVKRRGGIPDPADYDEPEDVVARILDVLDRELKHDFSWYKQSTILRRLDRRVQLRRCAGLEEYRSLLEEEPDERQALYEDLLIGVTGFYRDLEAYRTLREQVVPRIVSNRKPGEAVRIWVAGCGTGQEAYSLAILFHEALRDRGSSPSLKVFGTDVNENALAVARRGVYPHGISDEVPDDLLDRYFRHESDELRITDEIREQCIFARQDVVVDPPFSDLDLISCRNVLIYLKVEAQERILPLFHYGLRPGGYLFLGASERVTRHERLFREIEGGHRIFRRRETAARVHTSFPLRSADEPTGSSFVRAQAAPSGTLPDYVQGLERILLAEYTPACVIADADREIVYFHGRTGDYLEPATGRPSDNLIDMARPGLRHHLRDAIAEAERTGESVVHRGVVMETTSGWERVDLTVRPIAGDGEGDHASLVLFQTPSGQEPPAGAEATRDREERPDEGEAPEEDESPKDRVIARLEDELTNTREQLNATVRELESSNEDLRAVNEELISMNEELQSSNEELQTAQEETESVNEELQTVNVELAQKVEQVKEAHADLENLFRSTEIATVFLDRELRIKRFTPAATDVFRLRERDTGRPINDITPRIVDDGENLTEEIRRVLNDLQPVDREIRVVHGDAWYTMRIFPYRTVEDVIDGVVLTFVDITEIKQLEQERGRLGAIVEGMHDAVVGCDLQGTITTWNEGAERLYGYEAGEAVGSPMSLIVPPEREHELDTTMERVIAGKWTSPSETLRTTRDGDRVHVSINLAPIRDENGEVVEISETARDITSRIEAERAVREAEQRKNEFLSMLGHELRTPLGTIRNCMAFWKQGETPPSPEEAESVIGIVDRQTTYLANLVDDLTDMARMTTGVFDLRLQTLDLSELIRESVADHRNRAAEAGVKLEVDLPDGELLLEGDRTRLAQVLGNLIQNSCKYSPEGGRVLVSARASAGTAVVSVEDEGIGLEQEDLAHIFEVFRRGPRSGAKDKGGLGLGLPVARSLVELHGGTLHAASKGLGQGAEFTFRIPLHDGVESLGTIRGTVGEELFAKTPARRVLVVEDDRDAAHTLQRLLRALGHEVSVAYEASSALEAARDEPFDVVLCDLNLPGEMDGYALARALRSEPELADLRLVAVTGYGNEADRKRSRQAGFEDHVTKPIEAEDLNRVLTR